MILRQLTQALRRQDWGTVLVEILIVVLGVFIGIQVANWNEWRLERDLEWRYLTRLEAALSSDIIEHDHAVRLANLRRQRCQLLIRALQEPDVAETSASELFDAVVVAGFTYHPVISDAVFQEMVSTGNARIIRNEDLRDQIARYYGSIDGSAQWAYIREHTQLEYMNRRAGVLTPDELRKIELADGTAEFTSEEVLSLIERIRQRPSLIEWLPYAESWQLMQSGQYAAHANAARELRERIREALGADSRTTSRWSGAAPSGHRT